MAGEPAVIPSEARDPFQAPAVTSKGSLVAALLGMTDKGLRRRYPDIVRGSERPA